MRQVSLIGLVSLLALFIGGCPAGNNEQQAGTSTPSPSNVIRVPRKPAATPFGGEPLTRRQPGNVTAVAGLVKTLPPEAVIKQITKANGRSDPFAAIPVQPEVTVSPNPVPAGSTGNRPVPPVSPIPPLRTPQGGAPRYQPSPPRYQPSPPRYQPSPPRYQPSPPRYQPSPPRYQPSPPKGNLLPSPRRSGSTPKPPVPSSKVTSPPRTAPTPPSKVTPPPRIALTPPRKVTPPPRTAPTPPSKVTPPPRIALTPPRKVTPPPRTAPTPPSKVTPPPRTAPTPPGKTTLPVPVPAPKFKPELPKLPEPTVAQSIEITGVAEVGGVSKAIVKVPNEPSRTVQEGDRLANGQVVVKRIEVNRGPSPVVVLEQYGIEVAKQVGEKAIAGPGESQPPAAALPAPPPLPGQNNTPPEV